jgi:hypothetical protein
MKPICISFFTVSLHEIDLKPILWNPYSIPVPKINRYETDMYIGFKPNYYIKSVLDRDRYRFDYRHRCQTCEKAIYEYKVSYKTVIS